MRACSVGERREIRHKQTEEMFSRLSRPSHSFPLLLQVFIVLGGKERTRLHFFPSPLPSLPGHGKRGGGREKMESVQRKEGGGLLLDKLCQRAKEKGKEGECVCVCVCVWARLSLGSGEKSGTGSHLRKTNPLQGGGEKRENYHHSSSSSTTQTEGKTNPCFKSFSPPFSLRSRQFYKALLFFSWNRGCMKSFLGP